MTLYLAKIAIRILMKECVEVVYLIPPKRNMMSCREFKPRGQQNVLQLW